MAQEFRINSSAIEQKINQLLPSQGGFGAGIDFSASTMVIPVVDLTETAEGSQVRQDLQTALSYNDITSFDVENTTTTILNTTGWYRVFGTWTINSSVAGQDHSVNFTLGNGVANKIIYEHRMLANTEKSLSGSYDFLIFMAAGNEFKGFSQRLDCHLIGCTKQVADLAGNLTTNT